MQHPARACRGGQRVEVGCLAAGAAIAAGRQAAVEAGAAGLVDGGVVMERLRAIIHVQRRIGRRIGPGDELVRAHRLRFPVGRVAGRIGLDRGIAVAAIVAAIVAAGIEQGIALDLLGDEPFHL